MLKMVGLEVLYSSRLMRLSGERGVTVEINNEKLRSDCA